MLRLQTSPFVQCSHPQFNPVSSYLVAYDKSSIVGTFSPSLFLWGTRLCLKHCRVESCCDSWFLSYHGETAAAESLAALLASDLADAAKASSTAAALESEAAELRSVVTTETKALATDHGDPKKRVEKFIKMEMQVQEPFFIAWRAFSVWSRAVWSYTSMCFVNSPQISKAETTRLNSATSCKSHWLSIIPRPVSVPSSLHSWRDDLRSSETESDSKFASEEGHGFLTTVSLRSMRASCKIRAEARQCNLDITVNVGVVGIGRSTCEPTLRFGILLELCETVSMHISDSTRMWCRHVKNVRRQRTRQATVTTTQHQRIRRTQTNYSTR